MAERIFAVDENFDFPAPVAARQAERVAEVVESSPTVIQAARSAEAAREMATDIQARADNGEFKGDPGASMSHKTAWDSGGTEALRNWFRMNTGPRIVVDLDNPIIGLVTIDTQAKADALRGKLVRGSVRVAAPNLDVSDFIVEYNGYRNLVQLPPAARGVHLHDFELDGRQHENCERGIGGEEIGGALANTVTIERGNFHDLNDGTVGFSLSTIRHCWLHDPFIWDELVRGPYKEDLHPHSDGIQFVASQGTNIIESFIEYLAPTPNIISAAILNTSVNVIKDVKFKRTYLAGGGYTVTLVDDGSGYPIDTTFEDCRWGGGYNLGLFNIGPASLNFAGRNLWADTMTEIPHEGTTDKHPVLIAEERLDLGHIETFKVIPTGAQAMPGANQARYLMALNSGVVRRIGIHVQESVGNICVGVYRGKNSGPNRTPDKLLVSVTVPCPPREYQIINLPSPVTVRAGDFLALSTDNATASFIGFSGSATPLISGSFRASTDSFPLKDNPTTSPGGYRIPGIIGLP